MLETLKALLYFGGYGLYIWPCYIICLLLFICHIYLAILDTKKIKRKIVQEYAGINPNQNA